MLCYEHHKVTDNVDQYTTEKMLDLKYQHEEKFRTAPTFASTDQIDKIYHQETLKSLEKISGATSNIIATQDLHTALLLKLVANQTKEKGTETEGVGTNFNKQIDTIIALRSKNQHNSAILLFEKIKSDDWDKLTPREKFRVQANLGILYLDLLENEKAAEHFIDSLSYQPEDAKAINWGILGYSIIGNHEEAELLIAKGLEIDPLNIGIYSSLVRLKKELSLAALLEIIPENIRQKCEIAYEISRNCLLQRNFDDAITWAQVALNDLEENKYELRAILATTILESIQQPYLVSTEQVNQESKNKAKYIVELYTLAWEEVKHSDLRISRAWFLVNRSVAKKYLGDYQGCYSDIKEALEHRRDSLTLRHLAVAAFKIDKQDETLEIINELKLLLNGNEKWETEIFEAQLHWQMGEIQKSIVLMEKLLLQELSISQRAYVLEFLADRFLEKDNIITARKFNKISASLDTESLSPKILEGKILLKEKKEAAAILLFKSILSQVDMKTKEVDIHDLSIQFENLSLLGESIALLEKITNQDNYSSHTRRLLQLYYKAGEDSKLLALSERLIFLYGPIPYVTELKSYVYEKINDFDNAIQTCLDHLEIYPEDQYIQIRLALIYSMKEDWDNVSIILDKIDHIDRSLHMEFQFKLAMLCHESGKIDKFRHFAYETRRHFIDDVATHEYFIHLGTIVSRDEERPSDPLEIGIDSVVTVISENTTIQYSIEDRNNLSRIKGEISPTSIEGMALIGKKLNDKVIIGQHSQEFTITNISHKYNEAMRESFKLIGSTFATQTNFRSFTIGKTGNFEEDFAPLFENLDLGSNHDEKIAEFYKKGNIPISTIANAQKKNVIKTWGIYISDEDLGLVTTTTKQDVSNAFINFDNKTPMLLDVISLCTIAQLNCYAEIELLESPLYVAESSMLVINEIIHELKGSSKTGSMTIGKKKGRYIHNVNPPAAIQNQIEHLTRLTKWIKRKFKSLPCTAALKMNGREKKKLDEAIGESTIDSILTAHENNFVLYAEEAVVRNLAIGQHNVIGTATYMVFLYLRIKKKIAIPRYIELSIDLIGLNYKSLPVDAHILLTTANRTKFEYQYPLTYVTKGLISDQISDEFTIAVVCDYFIGIYKQPITFIFKRDIKDLRKDLVIQTLKVLSEKYDIQRCEAPIMQVLKLRLGQLDPEYLTLQKILREFCLQLD